jgi:hypothetical protein
MISITASTDGEKFARVKQSRSESNGCAKLAQTQKSTIVSCGGSLTRANEEVKASPAPVVLVSMTPIDNLTEAQSAELVANEAPTTRPGNGVQNALIEASRWGFARPEENLQPFLALLTPEEE